MATATTRFTGRTFSAREMTLIREVVQDCSGLSRMELARTVCELLRWRRPNGRLKAQEIVGAVRGPCQVARLAGLEPRRTQSGGD